MKIRMIGEPRSGTTWTMRMLRKMGVTVKRGHDGARFGSKLHEMLPGYSDLNILLLVRDPRAVAVSKWIFIKNVSPETTNLTIAQYVMSKRQGVPEIVSFYNGWMGRSNDPRNFWMIRYEDLLSNPVDTLDALGFTKDKALIKEAVYLNRADRMKALRGLNKEFFRSGDPETRRARRCTADSFMEYIDDNTLKLSTDYIRDNLDSTLGYPI
jgi:hypothetical protein